MMGKCPDCGEWNSLVEEVEEVGGQGNRGNKGNQGKRGETKKPVRISEIRHEKEERMSTGFSEVDRVLGGGMVAGSVVLIAGEPGVGKSTLLLQIAKILTNTNQYYQILSNTNKKENIQKTVLYVSGEESEGQIAIRYNRMAKSQISNPKSQINFNTEKLEKNLATEQSNNLLVLNATNVDAIISVIETAKPDLLIIDSVQTIYTEDLTGTAGSVGQVRECAYRLSNFCKNQKIPLFLVGQITKEGAIAGPKVLEHLVDVVLYFEGERFQNLRILRVTKNRFGPVDEAGIFEMADAGLVEVKNPSELFLGRPTSPSASSGFVRGGKQGAVITCTLEGTRPLLAEIQALTVYTSFSMPRRVFSGLDFNRCQVILAILQKFVNIDFSHFDVYVSVSGGLKIQEPAADLAIALALVSSVKGIAFDAVCYGELGLLGDLRKVNNESLRLKEAKRLGFKKVMSAENLKNIKEVLSNTK